MIRFVFMGTFGTVVVLIVAALTGYWPEWWQLGATFAAAGTADWMTQ